MPAAVSELPDASMAYRRRIDDLVAALESDTHRGLTAEEAYARLQRYGRNELAAQKPVPGWRRFLAQFQDVLVILLLIATAVSAVLWFYERDAALPYEAIAIFAVVLLNATMGYIQESRAEAAVAALRAMSAADATVIRGGERRSIPAADIAPGDIILIEEGDTIPADARLIESAALKWLARTTRHIRRPHAGLRRGGQGSLTTSMSDAQGHTRYQCQWCDESGRALIHHRNNLPSLSTDR